MEEKKDIFDYLKVKEQFTPDSSYFEQLGEKVLKETPRPAKVIPLYKRSLFWVSAAAAAVLIVLFTSPYFSNQQEEDVLLALNEIPLEDLRSYVDENIEDFETDLIAEFVDEQAIHISEFSGIEIQQQSITNAKGVSIQNDLKEIDKSDILHYFENEEIELDDLQEDEDSFI